MILRTLNRASMTSALRWNILNCGFRKVKGLILMLIFYKYICKNWIWLWLVSKWIFTNFCLLLWPLICSSDFYQKMAPRDHT